MSVPKSAAQDVPAPRGGPWYINRAFVLILAGGVLSGFGDIVFDFTLILWAASEFGRNGSWLITAILLVSTLPQIIVGPVAGTLVDRWHDKPGRLVRMSIVIAVLILLLIPVTAASNGLPVGAQLAIVLAVVFVAYGLDQGIRPAENVLIGDAVPDALRERASSLNQIGMGTAVLIAPAITAPIFVTFGIGWSLLIDGLSFLLFGLLVRLASRTLPAIDPQPDTDAGAASFRQQVQTVRADLAEGLRLYRGSPVLMTLAIAMFVGIAGAGMLSAIEIYFVIHNLGGSAGQFGWFGTVQGAGSILGSVALGVVATRIGSARLLWGGLVGIGAVTVAYAFARSVPVGLAIIFLFGLVVPAIGVSVGPLVYRVTPRAFQGRVFGVLSPLRSLAMLVGIAVAGPVYAILGQNSTIGGLRINTLVALFIISGTITIVSGLYAWRQMASAAARSEMRPVQNQTGKAEAELDDARDDVATAARSVGSLPGGSVASGFGSAERGAPEERPV